MSIEIICIHFQADNEIKLKNNEIDKRKTIFAPSIVKRSSILKYSAG
jgi:hypothetical protein